VLFHGGERVVGDDAVFGVFQDALADRVDQREVVVLACCQGDRGNRGNENGNRAKLYECLHHIHPLSDSK